MTFTIPGFVELHDVQSNTFLLNVFDIEMVFPTSRGMACIRSRISSGTIELTETYEQVCRKLANASK